MVIAGEVMICKSMAMKGVSIEKVLTVERVVKEIVCMCVCVCNIT